MRKFLLVIVALVTLTFGTTVKAQSSPPRKISANDIKLESGYSIEPAVANLSVPTTAIFDGNDLIIAESGFANTAAPRILRISTTGQTSVIASENLNPPITGLIMIDGMLYVSHRGKVSVIDKNGKLTDVVTDLPSDGDHQNNKLALGPDGKIYMGQGTTTNSAVVGEDNYLFGWLGKNPNLHEIPCKDITLNGKNFESANPLTNDGKKVTTGAYKSFGTPSEPGEVIKGSEKCGGSIVRFNKDGTGFELVAWGLRNPFGITFDKSGQLWATYHGADNRGSRPVFNDHDYLLKVKEGAWYGWPEYFDTTLGGNPDFLWKGHPQREAPFMTFDPHDATNGLTISESAEFGHEGDIFVAMYGTFAPITTGANIIPRGFRVVRVDIQNKKDHDFVSNKVPGPAYLNQGGGLDRPSDVIFGPDNALYIVDWGAATLDKEGLKLVPQTGMVWRVYSKNQPAKFESGPIIVTDASVKLKDREPLVKNAPYLYKEALPVIFLVLSVIAIPLLLVFWLKKK